MYLEHSPCSCSSLSGDSLFFSCPSLLPLYPTVRSMAASDAGSALVSFISARISYPRIARFPQASSPMKPPGSFHVESRSLSSFLFTGIKAQVATVEQASTEKTQSVEAPVVVVTGASRGIGRAVALAMGKAGCKMNLLNMQLRYHDQFHCFRNCHQLIKLAPDARHLVLPAREPKLKQLVSFGAPYDSFSRGYRCVSLDDVNTFSIDHNGEEEEEFEEYLAEDGEVFQKTLRLVECAMFAAISGLAFLLSNSLAIERYFACFFALPIVLSTMRWGVAAGRKTMVATTVLLFVLSGPVKAITYLLLHGLLGFTMGTIWRLKASWGASVVLCSMVRAVGALVNVLIASYLIRENILALITINVHALFTYILSSMGIISVPSMDLIYFIFGVLLLLNCASFVFLLHLLYAVFFTRLGMKTSLRLPKWLEAAI